MVWFRSLSSDCEPSQVTQTLDTLVVFCTERSFQVHEFIVGVRAEDLVLPCLEVAELGFVERLNLFNERPAFTHDSHLAVRDRAHLDHGDLPACEN